MRMRKMILTNNIKSRACGHSAHRPFLGFAVAALCIFCGSEFCAARTLIHSSQIEDAYLFNTGDSCTGNILAPTSEIHAATFVICGSDVYGHFFTSLNGDQEALVLGANGYDIRIDPNAILPDASPCAAIIQFATTVGFDDVLGDKINLWSHSYKLGVSSFDLDITSDRNIKFHSDTVDDLFQILGDEGNLIAKHNITAGGEIYTATAYRFIEQQPGDKMYLYYPMYKFAISANDLDVYSDRYIKFHSDSNEDGAMLDADSGDLTLEGKLKSQAAVVGATDNPAPGYSLVADTAWIGQLNGADLNAADNDWSVSGDNLYASVLGNIGAGTSNIQAKFHVSVEDSTAVAPFRVDALSDSPTMLWPYRKPISIYNPADAQTDYQIKIALDTASLVNASKMKSDGADIRFCTGDISLPLDYWIESGINTATTVIWIEAPYLPGSATTTVYMCYGNPSAESVNSVTETFLRLMPSLTASWPFDEIDGATTFDQSGNTHDGTVTGATWVTDGRSGNALYFDGNGYHVTVADHDDFSPSAMSISLWVRSDGSCAEGYFIDKVASAPAQEWRTRWVESTGKVRLTVNDNDQDYIGRKGSCNLDNSQWRHLLLLWNGGDSNASIQIYLDGVQIDDEDYGDGTWNGLFNGSSPVRIGDLWQGLIDEVQLFSRVLNATEIADLSNNHVYSTLHYPGIGLVRKYATPEMSVSLGSESILNETTLDTQFIIEANTGYVGVGSIDPERALEIACGKGGARADDWETWSSRRLKKDITYLDSRDLGNLLSDLRGIRVAKYRYKADLEAANKHIGLIADEAPEQIVTSDGESISLSNAVGYLMALVKALQEEIDSKQTAHRERINTLEYSLDCAGVPVLTPTPTMVPLSPTVTPTPLISEMDVGAATDSVQSATDSE